MTAVQEKLIHQELALKIEEIQDGLSTLPKNAGKMENQQYLKSGTRNGHLQSRPLDLLEVYCGPNSQITTHVNRKGGHAMRFTFNDGDLGTLEGVQKLWLWIYMYEPRHIWLAPECRLWGKFSNLNMSKVMNFVKRLFENDSTINIISGYAMRFTFIKVVKEGMSILNNLANHQ